MATAQGMHIQEALNALRCLVWQVYFEDSPVKTAMRLLC